MIYRVFRILFWSFLSLLIGLIALGFMSNVNTDVSATDISVFRTTLGLKNSPQIRNYEQEIELIREIQSLILREAPGNEPIPEFSSREPLDLLRIKSGLCYDRSRTLDKIFSWYGFQTRHVFILFSKDPITGKSQSFWKVIFTKGANSHAVTEVKTSRGWVLVDSNSPWISAASNGEVLNSDLIYQYTDRFDSIPEYFKEPYWAIRGLYSRRGQFYRPFIPFPELNWHDFISWIWQRKF